MRIVHVLEGARVPADPDREAMSGMVRACLEIAWRQAGHGHRVTVVSSGPEGPVARGWHGVQIRRLPVWRRARWGSWDFSTHAPVVAHTWLARADIVHAHASAYIRFTAGRGRIVHIHTDPAWAGWTPGDIARVARDADAIVTVNTRVARWLTRTSPTPLPPLRVVHNGVSGAGHADLLTRASTRRALEVPGDAFLAAFVGAVVPEKGLYELTAAMARLTEGRDGPFLAVAGDANLWGTGRAGQTPYERASQRLVEQSGLRSRVRQLGRVGSDEVARLYAASDVLVMPSQWPEAGPLVLLEAMAAGLPVIASDSGGIPEYAGDAALLTKPTPGHLADALESIRRDPLLRSQMAWRSRRQAERFSWESARLDLEDLYRTLLGGGRQAPDQV